MNNLFENIDPATGLVVWTSFSFIGILLAAVCLVNILKSRFKGEGTKSGWIFVVLLLPLLGAIIYWAAGSNTKIEQRADTVLS